MNIKRDKLTDALEDFWGKGARTEVPAAQVDATPQDIVQTVPMNAEPQISREVEMVASQQPTQMQGSGKSIRDMVQEAIKNKQDRVRTQPSYYPQEQSVPMPTQAPMTPQPQPKQNFFSGFDSQIASSFARERGGVDLAGPMGPTNKLQAQFQGGMMGMPVGGGLFGYGPRPRGEDPRLARKANLALADYERQLSLNRMARAEDIAIARSQQLQRARLGREFATSVAEQRKQSAFKAGLPVYENWLDPWFGGKYKTKKPIYSDVFDPQGKKTGRKIVGFEEGYKSTPGFFGLMAGGLNTVYEGGKKTAERGYSAYKGRGGAPGILGDIEYGLSPEKRMYKSQKKGAEKSLSFLDKVEKDRTAAMDAMGKLSKKEKEIYESRGPIDFNLESYGKRKGDIRPTVNEAFDYKAKEKIKQSQMVDELFPQLKGIEYKEAPEKEMDFGSTDYLGEDFSRDIMSQFSTEGFPEGAVVEDREPEIVTPEVIEEGQTRFEKEEPETDISDVLEDYGRNFTDQEAEEAMADDYATMPRDEDYNDQDRVEDEYSGPETYIGYSDSFKPMKEMEDDE